MREQQLARHATLFKEFISEASRLSGDALGHQRDDILDLAQLYALVGQLRLCASCRTVIEAERAMKIIIDTYLARNQSLCDIARLAKNGQMNFSGRFQRGVPIGSCKHRTPLSVDWGLTAE